MNSFLAPYTASATVCDSTLNQPEGLLCSCIVLRCRFNEPCRNARHLCASLHMYYMHANSAGYAMQHQHFWLPLVGWLVGISLCK